MKIYNTLTKKKEEFVPIEPGKVRMYVCGPTVYNFIHIGNARPMIVFDTVRRYMEYKGYEVNYVSNFTDVDDKIIKKAVEEGVDANVISERYIAECKKDMASLNVRPATTHPQATQEICGMEEMIRTLIEKGYAYAAEDGTVYYRVRSFKDYGKLSHKNLDDLEGGKRSLLVSGADQKEDPLDFVLWKPKKEGEPFWKSPWCDGRPGWHIECSVMSKKYLGDEIDIHAGGEDLIFPHHENEIAQSEGCTGCKFVNYWLHNGFITINSEKMSKSLNNFFLAKDVLEEYSGDALRYFLLSVQYRNPLDYSRDRLDEAEKNMERLSGVIGRLKELAAKEGAEKTDASRSLEKAAEESLKAFHEAMDDDFNTGLATGAMFDLAKAINIYGTAVDGGLSVDHEAVEKAHTALKTIMDILGILEEVWEKTDSPDDKSYNDLMDVILAVRQTARKEKMYKIADEIRDRLDAAGIVIEDTPTGARWKRRGV